MRSVSLLVWAVMLLFETSDVLGHGRMLNPPARSSAWREDSRFPTYYDDNQMFCGGFYTQWIVNS